MWRDKKWSEKYFSQVQEIIRNLAGDIISIQRSNEDDDLHRATDFTIKVESGDIACRIRRPGYFENFGDITIRYSRPSGAPTEYEKIKQGFARWFLYGWTDESNRIVAWVFVDLDKLRASGLLENSTPIFNKDGTSFVAIKVRDLVKNGCVKASMRNGLRIVEISER